MRILVTGGCGFIGSNFIRFVLEQNSSDVLINFDKLTYAGNPANLADVEKIYGGGRYHFCLGDIADREHVLAALEEYKPDAVINFAAESHVDRSIHDAMPFINTNIVGTQVLLQACFDLGIQRFVQISTDEVYGSLGPEGKFTEQTPLDPRSPYSASKASADFLASAFWHTHGFPVVITRCSNNYGPYQFPEKLIPFMFRQAVNNEALPVYGDGLNVRDWIHVKDHCRGVWLALTKGAPGAVYNFGGDAERSNIEVVRRILQIMGKSEDLIRYVKDRPGHDRRYAMDFSLAARELGFAPEHSFEQGLAETVKWYQDNSEWLDTIVSGAYLEFINQWYTKRERL
ncbi:MAG: dTDP-glucose 4,6-dehydratase [Desulfovibrionaceae bacterium]|nr:dTDP-glucose 4,6-dehydratase [Desulfovibrionaceae bacterium]